MPTQARNFFNSSTSSQVAQDRVSSFPAKLVKVLGLIEGMNPDEWVMKKERYHQELIKAMRLFGKLLLSDVVERDHQSLLAKTLYNDLIYKIPTHRRFGEHISALIKAELFEMAEIFLQAMQTVNKMPEKKLNYGVIDNKEYLSFNDELSALSVSFSEAQMAVKHSASRYFNLSVLLDLIHQDNALAALMASARYFIKEVDAELMNSFELTSNIKLPTIRETPVKQLTVPALLRELKSIGKRSATLEASTDCYRARINSLFDRQSLAQAIESTPSQSPFKRLCCW